VVAIIPLALACVYATLVATHWGEGPGGFSTLTAVAQLFTNPWMLLAGWIHYLAFDLFIGAWEVRDSVQHRVSHFLVIPCLILTFLFGPIGLLLYFIIRTLRRIGQKTA
jgi:membrane protein insertase Oxa1/YidC/SpoIIIJ